MTDASAGRHMPLVSVIVPCLNGGKYLSDCLESLRAQTYQSLEIIVTDDGSTDDSVAIAAAFAKADVRLRLLRSHLPSGMAANWNRGLRAATGEYVAKLDCDDTMHPSAVEELVGPLESDAALIASFCRAQVCDEGLRVLGTFADAYWERCGLNPRNDQILSTESLREIAYEWTPLWNSSSFMISRETLMNFGGWDERFRCVADVDLILRILNRPGAIAHRGLLGVNYRVVEGSVSKRAAVDGWLRDELRVTHLKNFEVWRQSGDGIPDRVRRYYRGLRRDLLAGADVLSNVGCRDSRAKLRLILMEQPPLRLFEIACSLLRRVQRSALGLRAH